MLSEDSGVCFRWHVHVSLGSDDPENEREREGATAGGVMLPLSNMEGAENAETAEATWGMLVSSDTSGRSMRGVTCRSRGRLPTFGPPKASENAKPTSIGV